MIRFLSALFGIFQQLARYFADKQLIEAGKAEQANTATKEVEARVEAAHDAVAIPDAPRTERLRSRFDRSRSGE